MTVLPNTHHVCSTYLIMNTPIEILDEPLPFDREAWIGKRKKVPDNPLEVDQSIIDYCETLLEIPSTIIQYSFPSSKACVKSFITHTLPNYHCCCFKGFYKAIASNWCCLGGWVDYVNTGFPGRIAAGEHVEREICRKSFKKLLCFAVRLAELKISPKIVIGK